MLSVVLGGLSPLSLGIQLKVAIGVARVSSLLHDTESQVIYGDFPCVVTPM
jgi:hypothetical protein